MSKSYGFVKKALGRRIALARNEAGLTQPKLAEKLGVNRSQVAKYESGENSPRFEKLARLAEVTGKPIAWFFESAADELPQRSRGRKPSSVDLSESNGRLQRIEQHLEVLMDAVRQASAGGSTAVPMRSVPLFNDVPAGPSKDARSDFARSTMVPSDWTKGATVYCLTVTGRSMEPTLRDGDVIAVRQQPDANSGAVVLVTLPGVADVGEYTVKRLSRKGNRVVFQALNPAHADIVPAEDYRIEGIVIGVYRRL